MNLDNIDIKILKESYDEYILNEIDKDNVGKIYKYLLDNKIDYAKDIFINQLDLYLLKYEEFVEKFEKLKEKLGNDYYNKIGEDASLLYLMYDL